MNTVARARSFIVYVALAAAFFALVPATAVRAHGGGLDASGCHTNRKTGDYHCHRAQNPSGGEAGPPVKKSRNGICHDRSSPWYDQTLHYTAFDTVAACLDSGGRMPKT